MHEAIYCFDTASVKFAIYPEGPDGPRIIAQVGEDPLRDYFGATGGAESLVDAFVAHASRIEGKALQRYRTTSHKPVVLSSEDFGFENQIEFS
ncbi:hypothetical protein WKW80_06425 [Variovorax humicola]|uniref:DUF1488 family protein n=1 Tax=Variovorax humicola TaxID=1769758 RepID=A0ABU8VVE9_9BURK